DPRLRREAWNGGGEDTAVDLKPGTQPIREPRLLDGQILTQQVQFLIEGDRVRQIPRQRLAKNVAQLLDHLHRAGAIAVASPDRDGIQRVEKKMWTELSLERREPRAGELLRQPRELHFALAGFCEVPDRMGVAGNRQI